NRHGTAVDFLLKDCVDTTIPLNRVEFESLQHCQYSFVRISVSFPSHFQQTRITSDRLLQPSFGQCDGLRRHVNADGCPAKEFCCDQCRSAPTKRIEDTIAVVGCQRDNALQQQQRFLSRIACPLLGLWV